MSNNLLQALLRLRRHWGGDRREFRNALREWCPECGQHPVLQVWEDGTVITGCGWGTYVHRHPVLNPAQAAAFRAWQAGPAPAPARWRNRRQPSPNLNDLFGPLFD